MSTTVILISGANTGIGYEIAKKLLTDHASLHLFVGSRNHSNGITAVAELQKSSHPSNKATAIQLDLGDDTSITSCVSTIKSEAGGRLDVLINNAGISPKAEDSSPASLRKAFADAYSTNVVGTTILTDACVELLSASALPRVIFITSGLSSLSRVSAIAHANPRQTAHRPYIVSKCAMNMLAVMYGVQVREKGWRVNLVCPGLRKTKLTDFMESASDPADGAVEAVKLAMDTSEEGRNGGLWDWDGTPVAW